MSVDGIVSRYARALEDEMRAVVHCADDRPPRLLGMLQYHLGWVDAEFVPCDARSGKRVRPTLCLLACEASGGHWEAALPAASAVELLHNFTLIHDDIEDQDATRRGRPALWSIWGEAQAINAGDTLFALSQLALLRLGQRGVPSEAVVQAVRLFNRSCVAITGGQYLDLRFERDSEVSVQDYVSMVGGKTAALVACSCELGALVADASAEQRDQLHAFGRNLGLAFQLFDDILGIWGDTAVTGKPVGADIAREKKTLPLLHGLGRSAELRKLLERDSPSSDDVRRARHLMEQVGSRQHTEGLALGYHEAAVTALEQAGLRGSAVHALRELAEDLLNRRW